MKSIFYFFLSGLFLLSSVSEGGISSTDKSNSFSFIKNYINLKANGSLNYQKQESFNNDQFKILFPSEPNEAYLKLTDSTRMLILGLNPDLEKYKNLLSHQGKVYAGMSLNQEIFLMGALQIEGDRNEFINSISCLLEENGVKYTSFVEKENAIVVSDLEFILVSDPEINQDESTIYGKIIMTKNNMFLIAFMNGTNSVEEAEKFFSSFEILD